MQRELLRCECYICTEKPLRIQKSNPCAKICWRGREIGSTTEKCFLMLLLLHSPHILVMHVKRRSCTERMDYLYSVLSPVFPTNYSEIRTPWNKFGSEKISPCKVYAFYLHRIFIYMGFQKCVNSYINLNQLYYICLTVNQPYYD